MHGGNNNRIRQNLQKNIVIKMILKFFVTIIDQQLFKAKILVVKTFEDNISHTYQ